MTEMKKEMLLLVGAIAACGITCAAAMAPGAYGGVPKYADELRDHC